MSGPKTSSYSVSAAERARLAEQQRLERERREELRRVALEKEAKAELLKKLRSQLTQTGTVLKRLDTLQTKTGATYEVLDETKRAIKTIEEQIKSVESSEGKNSQTLHAENDRLRKSLSMIAGKSEECRSVSSQAAKELHEQLDKVIECGFVFSYDTAKAARDEKAKEIKTEIQKINRLFEGFDPTNMPPAFLQKYKKLKKRVAGVADAAQLKELRTLFIMPFLQECEAYREMARRFETLYVTYLALADTNNIQPEEIECSEEGIRMLEERIEELSQLDMQIREVERIYAVLSEVMTEMGYELYGERDVAKQNGERIIHHQLFTIGEDTVLDVWFEDDGQISMKVGKGDVCDRQPTEAEIAKLIHEMEKFCDDYDLIEAKLREHGIVVNRGSRKPASKEHAQIVNKKKFDTAKKGQGSQKKETQSRAQKKRQAKQKQMRVDPNQ